MASLWNKSKKKLQAVNASIDSTNADIATHKSELEALTRETTACDLASKQLLEDLEAERRQQKQIEEENTSLNTELNDVNKEIEELSKKIEEAKKAAEQEKAEKERLLKELAEGEEVIRREHAKAHASTEAARAQAERLQADQEEERKRWQTTREAHELLQKQFKETQELCGQAKAERDAARARCIATREELRDLEKTHQRLGEEHRRTEELLGKEAERKQRLEAEHKDLTGQHADVMKAHGELEEQLKQRRTVLAHVTGDLEQKRSALNRELGDFQQRFQDAKEQRERHAVDHDRVKNSLGEFLPEYFGLQTEHAERRRALETTRRKHEALNWEHHKVHRDLDMLAKSYESGLISQLPPLTHR